MRSDQFHKCRRRCLGFQDRNFTKPLPQPAIVQPQRLSNLPYTVLPRKPGCRLPKHFRQPRPARAAASKLIQLTL
jgi:hypothetical protein